MLAELVSVFQRVSVTRSEWNGVLIVADVDCYCSA